MAFTSELVFLLTSKSKFNEFQFCYEETSQFDEKAIIVIKKNF